MITVTQVVKIFIKGIVKKIFYKEGHDKMDAIKKIFTWMFANKKSLLGTIIGAAGAGVGIAASWSIDSLPQVVVGGFNIAPIIYTIVCLICFALNELGVCGRGFETIVSFLAHSQANSEKKEELAIERAAKKDMAKAEKVAAKEEKRVKNEAIRQAKEEEKKRQDELFAKKVEEMKAQLVAQNADK